MLFSDAFTMTILSLYFRFMTKNWLPFQIYAIVMNVLSTLAVLMIPESPKYLYSNKQYKKAREAIHYIARFNRVKMLPFRFDLELSEPEQMSLT